jgi:hypothetical protein
MVETQQYNLEQQNLQILKIMVIKLIEDVDLLLAKLVGGLLCMLH